MNRIKDIDGRAVFRGVVGALVSGIVIGAAVGFLLGVFGFAREASGGSTGDGGENSLVLYSLVFTLGLLPNVIGGYVAAAYAGQNEILNGVATGCAMLAVSVVFSVFPDEDPFTLTDGLGLILMVPLGIVGAFARQQS